MKSIAVLMCAVTAAAALSFTTADHEEWTAFKLKFQKSYETELEEEYRMKIYAENSRKVARHNELFARGLVKYSLKTNKYSDLTQHEFVSTMNGYNRTQNGAATSTKHGKYVSQYKKSAYSDIPEEVDWNTYGAVTPVQDQGQCRSCWAFSSTGALEGQHYLYKGALVSLSKQNLVDCSWDYGNMGCRGGIVYEAFNYILDNEGIDTEDSYPYEAQDGTCRFDSTEIGATMTGIVVIDESEEDMLDAVANAGPISVAIYASLDSFRLYESGVYDDDECTSDLDPDHSILIVGYGTDEEGGDYWLIKNSWGESWGMDGFGKIARNRNLCAIASDALYPTVY